MGLVLRFKERCKVDRTVDMYKDIGLMRRIRCYLEVKELFETKTVE